MPPIPSKTSKRVSTKPKVVSAKDVYDEYNRSLNDLLYKQKISDNTRDSKINANSQYSSRSDSSGTMIYRDVFPGRKYKLTFSDTSWLGEGKYIDVGYNTKGLFVLLARIESSPEDNAINIELPVIESIDYLEARLMGATSIISGYLEDTSDTGSIWDKIADIIDKLRELFSGQEDIEEDIEQIKADIRDIKDTLEDHEERISALERS